MDRSADAYAHQLEMSRGWKKENPERHAELARAYRARNREKTAAQNAVNYAVRTGRLVRGNCVRCGTAERVHAHHDDYTKPLDVRWLCYLCHKAEHPVDEEDKLIKFKEAKKAQLFGANNPNASLSEATVRMIRRALLLDVSQEKIAESFGTNQVTVSRIKLGQTYSDVKD